ncbi:hypothetical protein [Citreimonas salinaria]|uniref:Helix-turn-helix domain-containing protein n=1 Tax=Citreimonas salinaria TaxID=321339 RepID=A0A1H3MG77_9RHOB|nr:hypothetical protein [Citreimonas salinaria]SDY75692.1 hypothetical protein SAMN05444340_11710 [Citreimonas salinaria]
MGRDKRNEQRQEHFTTLTRPLMETDAWRALSPVAQALYPWIKLEWRGPKANNNGKISLSVRQAKGRMGIGINTAARAFHELQAKGFLVVREHACLGIGGEARSPAYEITEIPLPHSDTNVGRRLYNEWRPGRDFPVLKAAAHNPNGSRKIQNPVIKLVTCRHQNGDV